MEGLGPMAMMPPVPAPPESVVGLPQPMLPPSAEQVASRPLLPAVIPRRDKSLSALSHELIESYGQDGRAIDLDEVQVRGCPRVLILPPSPDASRPPSTKGPPPLRRCPHPEREEKNGSVCL
jgi:hypothetical protein